MGAARRRGQPQFLPAGVPLRARTLAQCQGPHILSGRQPGGKGGAQAGRQAGRQAGWGLGASRPSSSPHGRHSDHQRLARLQAQAAGKEGQGGKVGRVQLLQAGTWTGGNSRAGGGAQVIERRGWCYTGGSSRGAFRNEVPVSEQRAPPP